ncbi:MAG: hypothetical protein JXL97_14115 [Bacteroidales bacterium]|nr:hypothetical protein [Bacteroidales bacterium]
MQTKSILKGILSFCLIFVFFAIPSNVFADNEPDAIPSNAEKANFGFYLMNVYDMDFSTNSFYADFYIWAKWTGEIDPFENLEFTNYIEKWGFTKEYLYDTTQFLEDGTKYNILRVEGRFFQKFSLYSYPMDKQKLVINIENSVYSKEDLVLLPITEESGIDEDLHLPGWKIKKYDLASSDKEYQTNFGDTRFESVDSYSDISFELYLTRPLSYFIWKIMLPLLVVLITSLGATFIFPGYIDARIYMPIGGLLTAVFLQQGYSDSLPDVGYLVLIDKIYVISYIIIIVNMIQAIITANMVSSEEDEDIEKVKKIDRKFSVFSFLSFLVGVAVIIWTSL